MEINMTQFEEDELKGILQENAQRAKEMKKKGYVSINPDAEVDEILKSSEGVAFTNRIKDIMKKRISKK